MFDGQPKEVIIYETADGTQPFIIWRERLRDAKTRAVIRKRIERLERGNPGDFKCFGDICELRIDYGPGFRLYLAFTGQHAVLLLCGRQKHARGGFCEGARVLERLSREVQSMMRWSEYAKQSLATDAEEAAAYLRLALEEAAEDPAGLVAAFNQVTEARGSIDDLGLSVEERAELASALSRSLAATTLQQAA